MVSTWDRWFHVGSMLVPLPLTLQPRHRMISSPKCSMGQWDWKICQHGAPEAASFLDPSSELRWLATAGIQALQVGTLQQNLMNIWGNGWRMETLGLKVETHTVESWKSSWFSGKVFPKTSPLLMAIVKQLGNPPVRQKKLLRQEKTLLRTGKTL